MLEQVKDRLLSFGYVPKEEDESALLFSIRKVSREIQNDCNAASIPEGLLHIAVDRSVGEFLLAKKTFSPEGLDGIDLSAAVKELREGDVSVSFHLGDGSFTAEQRLDSFIRHLVDYGQAEFSAYRRIKW